MRQKIRRPLFGKFVKEWSKLTGRFLLRSPCNLCQEKHGVSIGHCLHDRFALLHCFLRILPDAHPAHSIAFGERDETDPGTEESNAVSLPYQRGPNCNVRLNVTP